MSSGVKNMEMQHQPVTVLRCKLAIIGDAAVGKTALVQMLHSGGHDFPKNYILTSSVDLSVKIMPLPDMPRVVELYIFDCGGQSIFNQREFGSMHYENASMFCVVYDMNNRESFKSCAKWIQDAANSNPQHRVSGALIANKCDMRTGGSDAVSTKEGQKFAEECGLAYFETSALQGIGINEPFNYISQEFHRRYEEAVELVDQMR